MNADCAIAVRPGLTRIKPGLLIDVEAMRDHWARVPAWLRRRLAKALPPGVLAMVGFVPNEGETLVGNLVFKNADVDRGTTLNLGLFTNVAPAETITEATITEPTGGTYARISLADASWSVVADLASFALQTFTATGSPFVGSVQGYFVASAGTVPRVLLIEVDPGGPYTFAQDDTYDITLNATVA